MSSIARRDFGSFHSSNVEELLNLTEDQFIPLSIPFPLYDYTNDGKIPFGRSMHEKYFLLDNKYVFLNHGAFGCVLRQALEYAHSFQYYIEKQPLRFYDREVFPRLVDVIRNMAKFLGCTTPRNLILVENVTFAWNSVVRSLNIDSKSHIFITNTMYGAYKKFIKEICLQTGATLYEFLIEFPIQDINKVLDKMKTVLKSSPFTYAFFDHIPSNAPFILPINELCHYCKQLNITCIIDGAHALGSIDLRFDYENDYLPDIYLTNCHKWFCAPKGAGLLYIKSNTKLKIRPCIQSHGINSGMHSEFLWTGLKDYTSFLALNECLRFWSYYGMKMIIDRNIQLAKDASNLLVKMWNTSKLTSDDISGPMRCIKLPISDDDDNSGFKYDDAEIIQNQLYHDFNIEVPIKSIDGKLYVRISVHIYNYIEQYEQLGHAILEIVHR
jgi:selenocysteine lyase/cysteine desulfurase